jgi:1-acyl-sn-glycerol-3-phosphate acyltransferase
VTARSNGALATVRELAGRLLPRELRELEQEAAARLERIPTRLNEFGFDRFGMSPATLRGQMVTSGLLYRHYFRVETEGIERLPQGRVLVVGNHAGQLPFDAAMLGAALFFEAEPPRIARGMGEYWIPRLPFLSVAATRSGSMVGTPDNCIALLEAEECAMVFPEGVRGMNKLYRDREKLMRFGLGFLRIALQTHTPIVPVGIVGSDEQQPGLANLESLAKLFGMPAFPITPTFPLLGPLGLLPLPVKYRILFGEPLRFEGTGSEEDALIEKHVAEVRSAIAALLARGRRERKGIFRG